MPDVGGALVVCTGGGIGDVLLATPVMRALRTRYDRVVALTSPAHRDVLAGNSDLAGVWVDDEGFPTMANRIAAARFEAAIVTWATARSALLTLAGGVPRRVGQARRLYSAAFTDRVVVRSELGDRTTHWTQILLDFARRLDCDVADATPTFAISAADRERASELRAAVGAASGHVMLHPTRGIAAGTRWPTERLAEVGRALARRAGLPLLVTGSQADAAIAADVAARAGGVSIAGRTALGTFAALAAEARCVVAMDSGPMHVAAAVGAPTVGIFALQSDEPDRWRPLGARTAVVRGVYPCPAWHRKETCPDFACIANLDRALVDRAVEGLLEA